MEKIVIGKVISNFPYEIKQWNKSLLSTHDIFGTAWLQLQKNGSFVKQYFRLLTFKGTKTLNQKEKYMQQQSKQQLKI